MRLCYLTCLLICLSFNISSHEGKHFEFKECRVEADPLKPIPTRQVPPMYPRKALEKAIESNVLLEFTVNEKGRVEDPQVIWLDQTSSKSNKDLFSRSAINTVKKFKYKPGKTTYGEPISTDGVKVIIAYRIQGFEDSLGIDSFTLRKILRTVKVTDMSPQTMQKLEGAIKDIDLELNKDSLSNIEKAAFLYIKATTLFKLNRPSEDIKEALLESKSYYGDDYVDTLEDGVQVRGVTSSKLHTFGGLLLSQIYYEEEDWKSLEHEMLEVTNSQFGNTLKQRFYASYMQLGVASYTLENWCTSFYSFERARKISKNYKLKFPTTFDSAIEYAKSQMELVK
tara:strand:+ start:769 stop:1785 length:1017 start_codon:yes stop_codon:yes gene_type:complete